MWGGNHTWYLAREGFDTYAFDGSQSAIERVKKMLKEEELIADLRVRDALELDYPNNFFDCIIDSAAVYANCSADIFRMYQKIFQMLKSGGKLFSISFTTETTGYGTGEEIEHNTYSHIEEGCMKDRGVGHFFEEKELREILGNIGFRNIVIDILKWTDRGDIVECFLVQAEKE